MDRRPRRDRPSSPPRVLPPGTQGSRAVRPLNRLVTAGLAAAGTVGIGLWLAPRSPLPAPTGPHHVGTAVVEVEGPRRLPVQVWYPSTADDGPAAPLFPAPAAPAVVARRYGLPGWALAPLGRVVGTATTDAPADAAAVRGLVVMVHGWSGFRTVHADLAEQMASDGWVVLAADHVGGALVSQFSDGRVVAIDDELLPPPGDPRRGPRSESLVRRYAEDVAAVLDAASAGWDVGEVGLRVPAPVDVVLVGQSTGGGAVVQVAARDPRVAGLVGLDPWVEPVSAEDRSAVQVPMIAVLSGGWVDGPNDRLLQAMSDVEVRSVAGCGHTDLTGLGYLSPVLRLTPLTTCDPALTHDAAVLAIADLVDRVASQPSRAGES